MVVTVIRPSLSLTPIVHLVNSSKHHGVTVDKRFTMDKHVGAIRMSI